MNNNQLALNTPKTRLFAITEDINTAQSLYIDGTNVNDVVRNKNTINILGIKVSNNMKINDHIIGGKDSLLNQLNSRINALKKLVKISDQKFSINLANGLFMSKLTYGIQVWGLGPKYLLQKVQVLQNKAARTVLGYKAFKLNTKELLDKVNWLNINDLITFHVATMVHNIMHKKQPEYLYQRIIKESTNNTRNNIGRKLVQKPD